MKILEKSYYAKRISPLDGHYTFGYYDLQPFNGNLHLAHKFPVADRLQEAGDVADIGIIDINAPVAKFEKLAETSAWNHQQGAMLQWNPASPKDEIIYNACIDGQLCGVVMNVNTGKKRYLDRPVANVSPKGDYALSINFPRLYDFRPGYGYACYKDPYFDVKHSDEDGVFLIDMKTGKSRLIISMQEIWDKFGKNYFDRDRKLNINHITFNTDGTRFLMLVRNFREEGDKRHMTAVICSFFRISAFSHTIIGATLNTLYSTRTARSLPAVIRNTTPSTPIFSRTRPGTASLLQRVHSSTTTT